jgi:predicted XRE-type DNA-binding protein
MTYYENDLPVPVVMPPDLEAEEPSDDRLIRQETVLAALRFITDKNATQKQIAQRALLLLFIMDKDDFTTQKALAKRLGVTPARVCQLLAGLNFKTCSKPAPALRKANKAE